MRIINETFGSKAVERFFKIARQYRLENKIKDQLSGSEYEFRGSINSPKDINIQWDKLTDKDVKLFIYDGEQAPRVLLKFDGTPSNVNFNSLINDKYIMIWTPIDKQYLGSEQSRHNFGKRSYYSIYIFPNSFVITRGRELLNARFKVYDSKYDKPWNMNFKRVNKDLKCNVLVINADAVENLKRVDKPRFVDLSKENVRNAFYRDIAYDNQQSYKKAVNAIKLKHYTKRLGKYVIEYINKLNSKCDELIKLSKTKYNYNSYFSQDLINKYGNDIYPDIEYYDNAYFNILQDISKLIEKIAGNFASYIYNKGEGINYKRGYSMNHDIKYRKKLMKLLKIAKAICSTSDIESIKILLKNYDITTYSFNEL